MVRLRGHRLDRGANCAITRDLAEGAERSKILGGVQVGSTMVGNLADPCAFVMMVKDFGSEEVDFTREQHPHNQGMYPELVSIISPASQLDRFSLSKFGFKLPAKSYESL